MSLYWLLEEHCVRGTSRCKHLLYRSGSLQLKHIINNAGPELKDVEAFSAFLKVKSA